MATPTMAELRAAAADRVDVLHDELDSVRYRLALATGDERAALLDEEGRLCREIDHEPQRYGIARGQWLIGQALEAEGNVAALRSQAAAYSARADEVTAKVSKIADVDERDCEAAKATVFSRKAQTALAQAEGEQRNNLLTETKANHERRIAEIQAQIAQVTVSLEAARKAGNTRITDDVTGEMKTGNEFAEHDAAVIERLEAELAESHKELALQQSKAVSLTDPSTWPASVLNEVHATANAVAERIQRRAAKVRGKVF